MIAISRIDQPQFLKDNQNHWTHLYINGGSFSWQNKHKELLSELKKMSKNHCAFCDDLLFPFVGEIGEIEHFKPKEKYKDLAYEWANLYPICRRCNSTKNDRFDDLLLRPDETSYIYSDWFRLDPNTFELKPQKLGNIHWQRAEKTIELYGLSKEDKITRRQFEFIEIKKGKYNHIDIQPFRFI